MSKRTLLVIGVALLVAVAGVIFCASCQSKTPAMSDGPGMLYFYSPV